VFGNVLRQVLAHSRASLISVSVANNLRNLIPHQQQAAVSFAPNQLQLNIPLMPVPESRHPGIF